jgi:hypothetical protein
MTRRLRQVIIRPTSEAAHSVGLARSAGEDDHGQVRVEARGQAVGGPQAVEQVEAGAVLESEVEYNEAGLTHLDRAHALLRATRTGDPEAVRCEIVEQEGPRGFVILNHQHQALDVHTRRRAGARSSPPPPTVREFVGENEIEGVRPTGQRYRTDLALLRRVQQFGMRLDRGVSVSSTSGCI